MTDTNIDRAAQMAGFDDWNHVERAWTAWGKGLVKATSATLDELDAAKAELEAFKREVSEAAQSMETAMRTGKWQGVALDRLKQFILPKPDPLERVLSMTSSQVSKHVLQERLKAEGLEVRRIERE